MPAVPEAPGPRTLLAFDFGLRRIGVAVGQDITGSASPLGVIRNAPDGVDHDAIARLVQEWNPDLLLVGLPYHADGTSADMTKAALEFATELERYSLPIETTDERYSSIEATRLLNDARSAGNRGRIAKEDVDAAAAVLIAERYLAGTH